MKHKNAVLVAAVASILATNVAVAETDLFGGKVKAGGYLAQHWQTPIEVDGNSLASAADAVQDSGFQRLRVGLWFSAQISDRFSAYMELAEEPNDFQGANPFGITQDLAWIELKVTDGVALRYGNVVETTMNFIRYSDGAAVQGNPLIGNGVNDMITAAHGFWLTGGSDTSFGKWDYNLTLSKPSFLEDFSDESGYNYGARTSITTAGGLGLGAGVFIMDGDVTGCPTTTTCTLGSGGNTRSLVPGGDGDHYKVGQQSQAFNSQPSILPGVDGHIWQIDAMWSGDDLGMPVTIHGFYGQAEDDFSRSGATTLSTVDAEQSFWGIMGRVNVNDKLYLAARYGASENETAGVTNGDAERIQVGVGYWVSDGTLLKAEYLRQDNDSGSGSGVCDGTATGDCDFDGLITELSVSF